MLGGVSLALLTFVCFRLGLSLATTGFAYLILIALLSQMGTFIASLVVAAAAAGCLDYFFTQPLFSFRMEYPQDILGLIAFLTTAIIIARLTAITRKASEEAQASHKALIDTMPAHVWSALPDGSHDFHSRRWLEFSGLSAAEAAGDGWIATFHPDDRAKVVDKWRMAVATGEPFEAEARRRTANGEYRAFLGQARPLRDERGTIVKWCGSSTDLEDVKRATEALRESEAQWREVFEHNPAMYFMVDATSAVLSVNAFGAAQLGYAVDELVGQSVLNVFFEEDREFVQRKLAVCLEKLGQPSSWEVRKVRKDGATIWVRESAKAVRRANNCLIVLIACEDITESKRAKDALRQSEMYLAEAQRISRTGSFGWSVASGEIVWSEETFRIFEYDRTVKPTLELVLQRTLPEDRDALQRFLDEVSHEGKDWEFSHRLLMPDGSVKHVRAAAHAVKDASGKLEFIGAVMDLTAAKQAEEALRQSEMYLAEAQRISRTGSFHWSVASGEVGIMWSEETYRILEIDPTVKPTLELLFQRCHPEDRAVFERLVTKALQDGTDWESERRLLTPDGSVKHVRTTAHAVKDASGNLEFVGALMDVTAAKQAEEALRESEECWRTLTEALPQLVWAATADGTSDYFSTQWTEYTGVPERELIGWRWMEVLHPDDREPTRQFWKDSVAERHPYDVEFRIRRRDGAYGWFKTRGVPIRDSEGTISKWFGSCTDITDLRRTQEALRESEQRFRDFAETSSDWLWETGPDNGFTYVSENEYLEALGIPLSNGIGLARWHLATDLESEPEKWRLHRAMLDARQPFRNFLYSTPRSDGSVIYNQTSGKPFFDAKGNFLGYRGTGTDVTSAVRADQAEEALRKVQAELAHVARVTTLGELSAAIAHEVSQPLTGLVSSGNACLRWLGGETPNLEAARRAVERMINDGVRAGEVLSRIRALVRKSPPQREHLNVNDAITEVIALVRSEVQRNRISLRTELSDDLPLVLADRIQLQQVLLNLIDKRHRSDEWDRRGAERVVGRLGEGWVERRARDRAGFGPGAG